MAAKAAKTKQSDFSKSTTFTMKMMDYQAACLAVGNEYKSEAWDLGNGVSIHGTVIIGYQFTFLSPVIFLTLQSDNPIQIKCRFRAEDPGMGSKWFKKNSILGERQFDFSKYKTGLVNNEENTMEYGDTPIGGRFYETAIRCDSGFLGNHTRGNKLILRFDIIQL